jgi:hypothetical protein
VTFTEDANPGSVGRIGTLTIAGQTVTLNQTATTGTPTAPTPSPPALAPPPANANAWNVKIEVTAVTPEAVCIVVPSPGAVFLGTYTLAFGANTVAFIAPDPVDWDSYTVTMSGLSFVGSAQSSAPSGMCQPYVQRSSIVGSFSPDYNSFTATETLSFTFAPGTVKVVTFSWTGTRAH